MFLLSASEMRECDRRTIDRFGTPGPVLMERAGWGIFAEIRRRFDRLNRRRVGIVCGPGNNGGDGLVLARLLHDSGYNPRVFLTDPPVATAGDAGLQIAPLLDRRIPLEPIGPNPATALSAFGPGDLLIDAIFGTGFRGALAGEKSVIVKAINGSPATVIAIDIPSGLSADRGSVDGPAIRAELTLTIGGPKRSFLYYPAREHVGEWAVIDIGIPREVMAAVSPIVRLITRKEIAACLPPFPRNAHKGIRGKVLIAGGSPGLTGAPTLAALAAARSGAGLVRVAVARSLNPILEAKLTEPMTFPLPETRAGTLGLEAAGFLLSLAGAWDALVLGPGMGRDPSTDRLARRLVDEWAGPLIVDADGLNALAGFRMRERNGRAPRVLTPHPGEMARISGLDPGEIQADPVAAARGFAMKQNVVLVLKGAPTTIADPGGAVLVNPTGNPGLATGGSGDVLSGMIGAFLAQGIAPFRAAASAVYLHGLAGDIASRKHTERAMTPTDLIDVLDEAWEALFLEAGQSAG
jgi:ADP-dependent NAD(P)H-hydrate dehydratase / NAD(P)H-hydrate epimerase